MERYDSHIMLYIYVNYCKQYGHPRFWDKSEVICNYCQQKRGLND